MKNIIKKFPDETMILILLIVCIASVVGMKVIYDDSQISNTQGFINEVNEYQNADHKAYCDKAVSREASEVHLKEEGCK